MAYTAEFLQQNEVIEEGWPTHKFPDAKRTRDSRARELRKQGWTVECVTYDYTDLGRFVAYTLSAIRPRSG